MTLILTHRTDKQIKKGHRLMDQKTIKPFLYKRLIAELHGFGLELDESLSAPDKPWGSYLRISEDSVQAFIDAYWSDIKDEIETKNVRLDPKILLVAPGARLSLQYHHRRRERWRVLAGPIKIVLGPDGSSLEETVFSTGETVEIPCGYWHRIAGLGAWSVVAEIWEHITPENPSDEEDITRVEDDFSRTTG